MIDIELGEVQAAFADIIWAHEPVGSGELVKNLREGTRVEEADHLHRAPEAVREGSL